MILYLGKMQINGCASSCSGVVGGRALGGPGGQARWGDCPHQLVQERGQQLHQEEIECTFSCADTRLVWISVLYNFLSDDLLKAIFICDGT